MITHLILKAIGTGQRQGLAGAKAVIRAYVTRSRDEKTSLSRHHEIVLCKSASCGRKVEAPCFIIQEIVHPTHQHGMWPEKIGKLSCCSSIVPLERNSCLNVQTELTSDNPFTMN